jgi:hypothetical protein
VRKDLGAVLNVRPSNVEAKGVTRKKSDILQKVAPCIASEGSHSNEADMEGLTIKRSCNPMEYRTPQVDPANEVQVIR